VNTKNKEMVDFKKHSQLKKNLKAVYDLIDGKEAVQPSDEEIQELFDRGYLDFAPTGFGLKTSKGKALLGILRML
jgi:hypothetical protein